MDAMMRPLSPTHARTHAHTHTHSLSLTQSLTHTRSLSLTHSLTHSLNQSINQSINQSSNQSIEQSPSLFASHLLLCMGNAARLLHDKEHPVDNLGSLCKQKHKHPHTHMLRAFAFACHVHHCQQWIPPLLPLFTNQSSTMLAIGTSTPAFALC